MPVSGQAQVTSVWCHEMREGTRRTVSDIMEYCVLDRHYLRSDKDRIRNYCAVLLCDTSYGVSLSSFCRYITLPEVAM
jgi:hypothetical protein